MSASNGLVPGDRGGTSRWGFALVSGNSMRPHLRQGDRLLVDYRRPPRPGDVVVARLPGGVLAIKRASERRATELGESGWWLLSDNAEEGSDSRRYGAVADQDVLAVVVRRIWPLRGIWPLGGRSGSLIG